MEEEEAMKEQEWRRGTREGVSKLRRVEGWRIGVGGRNNMQAQEEKVQQVQKRK